MSDRLPPLTALRAFEAAARHLSFQRAAEELNVTPAALSYQIRNLEDHLGAPLFHRLNRAVDLTEAGRALSGGATDGFDRLRAAWSAARRTLDQGHLTVTAGPAFTAKFLAPRMFRFAQAHPDIELRFSASLRMMDFDRDGVDLAIRFGTGTDAGLFSQVLMHEWLIPMAHPDLAKTLRRPQDLAAAILIQDESLSFLGKDADWPGWFAAAGLPPVAATGPGFTQGDHALDFAQTRGGVILGRGSLTAQARREGTLVPLFGPVLNVGAAYRLVCPQGQEERPAIARFREWVVSEMQDEAHRPPGDAAHSKGEIA